MGMPSMIPSCAEGCHPCTKGMIDMAYGITRRVSVRNALAAALVTGATTFALGGVGTAFADEGDQVDVPDTSDALVTEACDDALSTAPQTPEEAEQNLESAQSEANDAQKAKDEAEENLSEAEDARDAAQQGYESAVQDAEDANTAAEEAFDKAKQDAQDAENAAREAAEAAEQELAEAEQAAADAEQQYDQAADSREAAQQDLEDAVSQAHGEAVEQLEQAQQELADAQDAEADAQEAYEAAAAEYERVAADEENSQDVIDAKAALDTAQQALDQATEQKAAAESAAADAQAGEEAADAEASSCLDQKAAAESAKAAADAAKDQAAEQYAAADAAERVAQGTLESAEGRAQAAQQALDSTGSVSDAKAAYDAAVADRVAKEAAVQAAEQAAIQAMDQGEKIENALEFFQAVGSTAGVSALTDSTYSSFTNVNDPTDATAINNVKATFQFIRDCNAIRSSLGLNELLVTDSLMAMAMANLNWSDTNMAHARQFNVGENLSWGYGTKPYVVGPHASNDYSNPFTGWYDAEKAIYDSAKATNWDGIGDYNTWLATTTTRDGSTMPNKSHVGHYLNVINPNYKYTGFAYNYGQSSYRTAFGQTFSQNLFGTSGGTADVAYTVDEYEQRFLNAIGMLHQTEEQQAAVAAAEAALADAATAFEAAQQAEASAKATYDARVAEQAQKQQDLDDAQQQLAHARAEHDAAVQAKNAAAQTLADAEAAVQQAADDVAAAEGAYQAALGAYNDAVAASDAANGEVARLAAAIEGYERNVATAQDVLAQAQANTVQAKAVMDSRKAAWDDAAAESKRIAGEVAALAQAEQLAANAEAEVNDMASKLLRARHVLSCQPVSDLEQLASENAAVRLALTAKGEADAAFEQAQSALAVARDAVVRAQAEAEQAQATLQAASGKALRAASLQYDGLDTEVTDADFAYLNQFVSAARQASQNVENATGALAVAEMAFQEAQANRDARTLEYAEALAALAIAQADFDRVVPPANPTLTDGQQVIIKVGNGSNPVSKVAELTIEVATVPPQDTIPVSTSLPLFDQLISSAPAHARTGNQYDPITSEIIAPEVHADAQGDSSANEPQQSAVQPTPAAGASAAMPKTGDGDLGTDALLVMGASLSAMAFASRRRGKHEA